MKMRTFFIKKLPIVIYKKLDAPNSDLKKTQFLGRIYTPDLIHNLLSTAEGIGPQIEISITFDLTPY